jgi:hypothetical protein
LAHTHRIEQNTYSEIETIKDWQHDVAKTQQQEIVKEG